MKRYNFTNPLFLFKIESMIRRFFILFCFAFLTTCDDGDILTVDLEFDGDLERCDNFEDSHLIYDTRDDPSEALILIFPRSEANNAIFTSATPVDDPLELTINMNTIRFIYRTYSRSLNATDICAIVPPSNLVIREDYEAGSGDVEITSTIIDDDNDGVPSSFEYGPGGLANPQDTDEDGIPDYLDEDDDNDNVRTKDEIDNTDGDDDPTTNPLDTDGDGIPNYLDTDDDGDLIPTRLEDANGANGPGDDRANNADGILVPHYLNTEESIPYDFEDYNAFENKYTRTVKTSFMVKNIDLDILRTTEIDFGVQTTVISNYIAPD